jgi:hypothetical protein
MEKKSFNSSPLIGTVHCPAKFTRQKENETEGKYSYMGGTMQTDSEN